MTIAVSTSRNNYPGTGTTGPFTYSFKVFAATDLRVTKRSAAGVESTLSYPGDFSATGVGDSGGGTITLLGDALAVGETISIRRVVDLLQSTNFTSLGRFSPSTHENQFDRLVMMLQQHEDDITRSLRHAESVDASVVSAELPAPSANTALFWNADADGLENRALDDSDNVALPGDGRTTPDLTALLANNIGKTFNILDYGADASGGTDSRTAISDADGAAGAGRAIEYPAGTYRVDSNITITAHCVFHPGASIKPASGVTVTFNGRVFAPPDEVFDLSLGGSVVFATSSLTTPFYVEWWGAVGDGATDDTPAFQLAQNALAAAFPSGGGILKGVPGKTYAMGEGGTADAFLVTAPCLLDFTGSVLKCTASVPFNSIGGGGGCGVVNVKADDVVFKGEVDCNDVAYYAFALRMWDGTNGRGFRVEGTIRNPVESFPNSKWLGIVYSLSASFPGVTVTADYHKGVTGLVHRPQAAMLNSTFDAIGSHADVSVLLVGGDATNTGSTGTAIVCSESQWNTYFMKPDTVAIPLFPKSNDGNTYFMDSIIHDMGCNQVECYGHDGLVCGPDFFGLIGEDDSPGVLMKAGAITAHYHTGYVPSSSSASFPPNTYRKGGSTADDPNDVAGAGASWGDGLDVVLGSRTTRAMDRTQTGGGTLTLDCAKANDFRVTVTDGTAYVLGNPTMPTDVWQAHEGAGGRAVRDNQRVCVIIKNSSGGAAGAMTFGAKWKTAGAWTQPANGKYRTIEFLWDSVNDVYIETFRSPADVG